MVTEAMNKLNLKELIKIYKKKLKNMIIMDDYDGGQASELRAVIADLENIESKKTEKTS